MGRAHIVFHTVGSLGDLYPFLAIGRQLRDRGYRITIAAHGVHREPVERAGLAFADASGMGEPDDPARFMAQAFDRWRGPRMVIGDLAANDVAASYVKLLPVCADAQMLVTTTLAFAGQIIAEQGQAQGRLVWLSAVLAPASFLSAFDPPASGLAIVDRWIGGSPRRGYRLQQVARWVTRGWTAPVRRLRVALGLPAVSLAGDPFHRGQFSDQGVLALFSPLLAQAQPDWPVGVHVTGFARRDTLAELDDELQTFLAAGEPVLVFTLGSAAVHAGLDFLRQSVLAARRLKRRAVLLTGSPRLRAQLAPALPPGMLTVDYAPHAGLFAQAAVVIHHGGIGTSAEALRAGRPMLVVPHGFDQPDNAARLARLGVARVIPAQRYRAAGAVEALDRLLADACYRRRAKACAQAMRHEDGAVAAAVVIEQLLADRAGRRS